ncbi:MAG: peptidylprolyl isomerase [Oscillospiraceae bacterium]|jgi:hypothetical protein|nr:peptidylprolyl isomerase [Oscillospiraceae bacterium]
MKLRKILAAALGAVMLLTAVTACQAKSARETFSDGTVMFTVGGYDVTWDEYYFYLSGIIGYLEETYGEFPDLSVPKKDDPESEGLSQRDYVLSSALDEATTYGAIEYGAKELGVALTDEDRAEIAFDRERAEENNGGHDAFVALLAENGLGETVYTRLSELEYLQNRCISSMFGDGGANLTDAELAEYTAEDDYLMAKHILLLTSVAEADGTSTPMTEEETAATLENARALSAQLDAYTGNDFDAFFDELMNANSEDAGGLALNPNGYLFQSGDMVTEFEEGTRALEIGGHSGVVATDYGYHIIYRRPVDYDAVPAAVTRAGGNDTLRAVVAQEMYSALRDGWIAEMEVVYGKAYKSFDVAKVFKAQ